MKVLLIEDSPTDALLTRAALTGSGVTEVAVVPSLADGTSALHAGAFDVVLLDLDLPDVQGLDTLRRLFPHCDENTAIVVLTGNGDEALGLQALQAGAQDYLQKAEMQNAAVLRRCLVYANERCKHSAVVKQLERALEEVRKKEEWKQENVSWSDLARSSGMAPADVRPFDTSGSIQEPGDDLTDKYCALLDLALEQRRKVMGRNASDLSARLALDLAQRDATPRDVISMHIAALRKLVTTSRALSTAQAYREEARLRLVEVLGFMIAYYQGKGRGGAAASEGEARPGTSRG